MNVQQARKLRKLSYIVALVIALWLVASLCWSLIPAVLRGDAIEDTTLSQERLEPSPSSPLH